MIEGFSQRNVRQVAHRLNQRIEGAKLTDLSKMVAFVVSEMEDDGWLIVRSKPVTGASEGSGTDE